jgi:hypothetical protein
MNGWLSLILRLLMETWRAKQRDHGTRHDCAQKEEEGMVITSRVLERSLIHGEPLYYGYGIVGSERSYDAGETKRMKEK